MALHKDKQEILQRSFDNTGRNLGNTTQVQFCYDAIFEAMEECSSLRNAELLEEVKSLKSYIQELEDTLGLRNKDEYIMNQEEAAKNFGGI